MIDLSPIRNRIIARILAVNDICPDKAHAMAMRAVVMAAVNEGFNEVHDKQSQQATGGAEGGSTPKGQRASK